MVGKVLGKLRIRTATKLRSGTRTALVAGVAGCAALAALGTAAVTSPSPDPASEPNVAARPLAPIALHDDDPKLLDRQGPYRRAHWQNGGYSSQNSDDTFPAEGIELLAWLPLGDFGAQHTSGNDCWGYQSPGGRQYALMGLSGGSAYVDITEPREPKIVAQIAGPASLWRDIKTYDHYAYVVSEGGAGIQVIDLGRIDQGIVEHVNTITDGGTTASHNVAIDTVSGYLYRCGGASSGLRFYNLANPAFPSYSGEWADRYVHDAQIVTYTSGPYAGRQLAYCAGGLGGGWTDTGLDVVDVTDHNNPVHLSHRTWSNPGYSHQCWTSPDGRYLYLNDELDEYWYGNGTLTLVFDLLDPGQPVLAGSFSNGNSAIGHNIYTKGNRIYEANYRSGLRVFDATDPLKPAEIAYFDTWTTDDAVAFNGLWSNYPYFNGNLVIGSDLEKGLFVWRVGQAPLEFRYPSGLPELFSPLGGRLQVKIREPAGTVELGTPTLHLDDGSGVQEIPLKDLGDHRWAADYPAMPTGTHVAYWFSARTTDGETLKDPVCAPDEVYRATVAAQQIVVFADDMETDQGWTVGDAGDTAVTGLWERNDPEPTAAQSGDDHSEIGTLAWVTDGRAGTDQDTYDVDGGATTLTSPVLDLRDVDEADVSFWHWFSNSTGSDPNTDVLEVEISANGGQTWKLVETVGPTGEEASPGWFESRFRVSDFVRHSARVQVRFRVSDQGPSSVVEALLDDFRVDGWRSRVELTRDPPTSLR